jgi:hypothetical protein
MIRRLGLELRAELIPVDEIRLTSAATSAMMKVIARLSSFVCMVS